MKKQRLKKKYWQRKKELHGRKPKGVSFFYLAMFYKNGFSGIFQNIHDSFDEIDSKTLNSVYKKSQSSDPGKSV